MIEIKDKKDCCGCHACASICAHHAITMQADAEGFLYPTVNKDACTDCGLCEQVCPVIHQSSPRQTLKVYAARSYDEDLRRQSSSGGIFTLLAEAVIREGGVVFGAKFDEEWNVIHAWTENIDGLADFRGSKYVQSTIGDTYREAKKFLQQGRKVLFTGTPCQIAGLKRYLRKDYDNLLTADVICHGVPSPLVWRKYLDELRKAFRTECQTEKQVKDTAPGILPEITAVSFRDKKLGWKNYEFSLRYVSAEGMEKVFRQPFIQNTYMKGFLSDLYLRPSCHQCPTKGLSTVSDITLGDYWGVEHKFPQWADDKGTSAVIVHTPKGMAHVAAIDMEYIGAEYNDVCQYNPALTRSFEMHRNRKPLFAHLDRFSIRRVEKLLRPTLWETINLKWYMIKLRFRT